MAALAARGLYRFYHLGDDEIVALRGVDLILQPGEFVALVGPSGSGKSTLLACLAGLDEPDGGAVEVMGVRISHRPDAIRARLRARHLGMLMQSGNLVGHLTVAENIRLQGWLGSVAIDPATLLDEVGLADRAHAWPSQLSGGEAARAGLCVALAAAPQVVICDEPTAEVDRGSEAAIIAALRRRSQQGVAILVATHSETLATQADRTLAIRDGVIIP